MFLQLLVLPLVSDVGVCWGCHIYLKQSSAPCQPPLWLVGQQLLFCLEAEVLKDLSPVVLYHLCLHLSSGLTVNYISHLVVLLNMLSLLDLTSCYNVLGISLGIFAQSVTWVRSFEVALSSF